MDFEKMDDFIKADFEAYKKEYVRWVTINNIYFREPDEKPIEIPADDILLSLALAKATEAMRTLNHDNDLLLKVGV